MRKLVTNLRVNIGIKLYAVYYNHFKKMQFYSLVFVRVCMHSRECVYECV